MPDINALRFTSSDAVGIAVDRLSAGRTLSGAGVRDYPLGVIDAEDEGTFAGVFQKVLDNINTTNGYLSDAENEEIRWALGETENTHDLTIALQKASVALQYTVAVRDRVIAAYREIMQMQI